VFLGRSRRTPGHTGAARERFDASSLGLGLLAVSCTLVGFIPALAVGPLSSVASTVVGARPIPLPAISGLPAMLFVLPFAGALAAVFLASKRGVRRVPTWTCGSPVTAAAQYTATAFSKPLRTIFAFALFPERHRTLESGSSAWFPRQIRYRTESRYLIDELARRLSAALLRFSRRTRAVQSGSLRLYLAYAIAALVFTVAVTR
jgi:hydrogenase-4 component B